MKKGINCSRCGKLFESKEPVGLCEECSVHDREIFEVIKEYLYENPRANIFDVSTNVKVSLVTIKRYLREGRLEIVEDNNQFLKCVACGESIHAGSYCEECLNKTNHDYKSFYTGKKSSSHKPGLNYLPSGKI